MQLIFRDNFFSAGLTEIVDGEGRPAGTVDLKSAFSSAADVYDTEGRLVCGGKFGFFSNRWTVSSSAGEELGTLRHRLAFFEKKYEYDAGARGLYELRSPVFSREYEILTDAGEQVAAFSKVNGFFEAGAYSLQTETDRLDPYELVCVILGMHGIVKRNNSAAANAGGNGGV